MVIIFKGEILEKVLDEPLPTRDISKISLTERIQVSEVTHTFARI